MQVLDGRIYNYPKPGAQEVRPAGGALGVAS